MKKILLFLYCIAFSLGCGTKTEQKLGIIKLVEHDIALVHLGNIGKIKNGDKVLVYREVKLTHPVSKEIMGKVRDEVGKFTV